MPSILLLVYDAEDARCRRLVDRVGRWDRNGRIVTFPYQNGELVRVAPELAGLDFPGRIYTLDLETRDVDWGRRIVPAILRRLPWGAWIPAKVPFVAALLHALLLR